MKVELGEAAGKARWARPGGRCGEPPIHSRRVEFEKWQALGNDYVILEAARLPFELTPRRVQAICAPHTGVYADGVLLLSQAEEQRFVARLRVFNPDGSEAEVSGNGAREAVLYLRQRGWTSEDEFSIETAAGELRPTITSPTTCTIEMGRARLQSGDYLAGPPDGVGELHAAGRTWRFQYVQVGNPQCAIRVESEAELEGLDLDEIGPQIERHELFPNRTNVSWFTVLSPQSDPGADLRAGRGRDRGQRHGSGGSGRGSRQARRALPGDRGA